MSGGGVSLGSTYLWRRAYRVCRYLCYLRRAVVPVVAVRRQHNPVAAEVTIAPPPHTHLQHVLGGGRGDPTDRRDRLCRTAEVTNV